MSTPVERMHAIAARIEALVAHFAASHDPATREKAQQLVKLLMEMYGEGLGNIINIVQREDSSQGSVIAALLRDELVASLLVLHDLHPEDRSARVTRELTRIEQLSGAGVTLVAISDESAHLHVDERRRARAPTASELRRLIEEIVRSAVPELTSVRIDGLDDQAAMPLTQLTFARATKGSGKASAQ